MADDTNPRARAIGALCELFFSFVECADDLRTLEGSIIDAGHSCIAEAFALALEAFDAHLLSNKPEYLKVHDVRSRTLATEVGDIEFSQRRYRDPAGNDVYLLADVLDIPYGIKVSPGATEFLVEAASYVSYSKAAKLLSRHGSTVRPTTVMNALRQAGSLCAEEDLELAEGLYGNGVIPDAERECESICMEADGTYFRVQGQPRDAPGRFEVKAMVAYEKKELLRGKVRRKGCVHHALVGSAHELWSEGVPAMGEKYDLAKIEQVHLGGDGEKWCATAERYLPRAKVTFHLEPFHVNHAIMSCFRDAKMAWNIIDVLNDGDKQEAIALLKACRDLGVASNKRSDAVIRYLEGNIDSIALEGPSLGTMESENQHLYGSRMDAVPCAWSVQGGSDMARLISRRESGRAILRSTRERSMGKNRRSAKERKGARLLSKKRSK